jgi:hypothetical protein
MSGRCLKFGLSEARSALECGDRSRRFRCHVECKAATDVAALQSAASPCRTFAGNTANTLENVLEARVDLLQGGGEGGTRLDAEVV